MNDGGLPASSRSPAVLRHQLRDCLDEIEPDLTILAEGVLAEVSPIDLVARDATGRAVLILIADEGEDAALLTRALAHRAWLAPRIRDWLQLAPELGLDPHTHPRCLLVGPAFGRETVSAAADLGPEVVRLALYRLHAAGSRRPLTVERISPTASSGPEADPTASPAAFRSGLRDEDLNLTSEERREFE